MEEQKRGQSPHDEAGAVHELRSGGAAAVGSAPHLSDKTYPRGTIIIAEGEKVDEIHLVLTGLAARTKTIRSGDRQFMALLVPGDLCDVEVFVLEGMDHDIMAMTETTCVLIPAKVIEGLLTESTKLTKALWWSTMTDSAVLREWIVDHGSRDSLERIAHLMCEMLIRYRIIGETTDDSFPFLLTQEELADALGMTPVHVNRMLQQLRSQGLIDLRGKVLTVLDPKALQRVAQFDSSYLHLTRRSAGIRKFPGERATSFRRRDTACSTTQPRR